MLATTPVLVGDINQTTDQLAPGPSVQVGNVAFFAGRPNAADGQELFKTDGTTAGTVLVKDINPTTGSSPSNLTKVGNVLYFTADDGTSGVELWKSDGTAAGTVRVADLFAGTRSSAPDQLTNIGGTLYFVATDANGQALWQTDGTAVTPVTRVGSSERISFVNGIAACNGGAIVSDGGTLYRINAAGDSIAVPIAGSPTGSQSLTAFGGAVYFTIGSNSVGTATGDLWRTDGTAAGTTLVKAIDFKANSYSPDYATLTKFTVSGDRLFFLAGNTPTGKHDLWASDGTTAGTTAMTNDGRFVSYSSFAPVGTRSVFFASGASSSVGTEPWVSDGTVAGTRLLKDLVSGTTSGAAEFTGLTPIGNGRWLFATSAAYGLPTQIWTTDGTSANTVQVTTINSAAGGAVVLGTLNNVALMNGERGIGDGDLYHSDGTANGTSRVGATSIGNGSGITDYGVTRTPAFVVAGDGSVYFVATDGSTGIELWRSVNHAAPTRVADLAAGGADAQPNDLVVANDGSLYFTAGVAAQRIIYRVANASAAPQAIYVTGGGATLSNLTTVGNTLYVRVSGGSLPGARLYRYDPAVSQAMAVTVGNDYLASTAMLRAGSYWYFGATPTSSTGSSTPGQKLYRIGVGASAVPAVVADIPPGDSYSSYAPEPLAGAGSTIYFTAQTAAAGTELWRSDGTAAGTTMVADLTPGTASTEFVQSLPSSVLGTADGVAYFTAYTTDATSRAYRTDRTAAGTYAIGGDTVFSGIGSFVASNGNVYFVGSPTGGPTTLTAVYRVDGTVATLVSPVTTGDATFSPYSLTVAGDRTYLIGQGGAAGTRWELWQADASFRNFQKVSVLGPRTSATVGGPLRSFWSFGRYALTATANDLYFPMYDAATGVEPYRLSLATTGSISGFVYNDANATAVRDANETAAIGVTVYADVNGNNAFDEGEPTAVSAASGYVITGIAPGVCNVRVVQPTDGRRLVVGLAAGVVVTANQTAIAADMSVTDRLGIFGNSVVDEGGTGPTLKAEVYGVMPTGLIYEWDFNAVDGTTGTDATGASVTFPTTSIDGPVTRTVTLRVRDASNSWVQTATQTISVVNAPPTATFAAATVAQGTACTVAFSNATDVAADVAAGFKYSFDFNNDGDFADPGDVLNSTSSQASFTFAQAGTYTIRGRIIDKDGGFSDYTTPAAVTASTPAAPTNVGFDNTSLAEGASATLFGFALPLATGQSIVKWEYDFNYDGKTFDVDATGQRPTFVAPDGNATRTIAVRVTDNFGHVVIGSQSLRIDNVAPTATLTATGGAGTATATFTRATDPSAADVAAGFKYSFDFNNDGDFTDPGEVDRGTSPKATGAYAAAGTYTILARIYDKDGDYSKYVATVTVTAPPVVLNQPPVPKFAFPAGLAEGDDVVLAGTATVATGRTVAKWEWDFDYDGATFAVDATGQQPQFAVGDADGPTASRRIALRVTDSAGQVGLFAASGPIANAPPFAEFIATADVDGTATLKLTGATDASAADRAAGFKYSFDFNGDGDYADAGEVANGASPIASFKYATAGTYRVRGRVTDKDGGSNEFATDLDVTVPPPTSASLTGTVIGTAGSFGNAGNTVAKAFDGSLTTYFDAAVANGAWAGLDLGAAKTITSVKFAPRAGWSSRMVGGLIQGSSTADFSGGVVTLATIASKLAEGVYTTLAITNAAAFRYVRYLAPAGSYGNVAELAFYGTAGTTPPPVTPPVTPPTTSATLVGTAIGTSGSFGNSGNTIAKAFDGSLTTFVDLPVATGGWAGLDLGAVKSVAGVRYAPRAGWSARMVGGVFQGSTSADFSTGVVTLATIAAKPTEGVLTSVAFASTAAYRYVRYLGPAGSYGDVAEVQFFGPAGTTPPPVVTPPATPTKLTGTTIGTAGSYLNGGNTIAKVFDGNFSTFFDGPAANGNWVGLDLGAAKVIAQIGYAPRSGFASRLVGGVFQGSNNADFSNASTLVTITQAPAAGVVPVATVTNATAFRYVRYVAPAGSYGDVAEIAFYG